VNYKNNYKEGNKEWYDKKGKVEKITFFKMDRPIKVMKKVQKIENPHIYDELRGLNFSPNRPQE
jgi:antitoxin component YwqK of YwqJK toxin-antitoxin module